MTTISPVRPATTPSGSAFKLFPAQVVRTLRLSPHVVRVTLGGPGLSGMTSGGLDQRVKVLFPLPGQQAPCLPVDEFDYPAVRAMPDEVRPKMRTYTVRAHRADCGEADIDFVLHGDAGPGSAFASRARPGDQVCLYAPNSQYAHPARLGGVEYRLDQLRGRTLIVGDETALPAIASIVESLPAAVHAKVCVEVPGVSDSQVFEAAANVDVTWVSRRSAPGSAAVEAVRETSLPGEDWYAWVAGESGMVKAVRRHLVRERGLDRRAVTFMGYWKRGETEDVRASARR